MFRKLLVVAALIAGLMALGSGTANAQDCGYFGCPTTPPKATTTTAPSGTTLTGVAGQAVEVVGDSCAPGSTVTFTWDDGTVLGTTTADDNGEFSTKVTIPANATPGNHTITATCGDVEQFITVNVLGDSVNNVDQGTLPRTGSSNTGPLVGIGAAALVLGAAFLYGARRPRNA
ncbi:MAG: LPXTG cell wall anchor domain-containing protein [Acidimicrobiales bacterium]|nr:LPXTG cell wall anchor domain-containing protein [Acidimicrobiales bacterium]